MQHFYYKEEQQFSNPGLWIFLAVVFTIAIGPTLVLLYSQLVLGKSFGENPPANMVLIILLVLLTILCIGTYWLFMKMKLVIEVRNDGVFYRYPPFIIKPRSFLKADINAYEIRKYKPSGIRYSLAKSGRAFNVKGNIGLQLYLKNGKKVLFGTQRPDALIRAMDKLMRED